MLSLTNISKTFPGVKALENVSIDFNQGEIHALLGENGAGKSTFIKIICGILTHDTGEILYNGTPLSFQNYRDAIDWGIELVNQEIQVIPESTVAENIFLERLDTFKKGIGLNWNEINSKAEYYLQRVGLNISPTEKVIHLSAAQKQLIQIAKALSAKSKILLLDEPTSALTKHEVETLFILLNEIKTKDILMLFVSHKLDETFSLCDKISVLRDGKLIGTRNTVQTDSSEIIKMMIGRDAPVKYMGELAVEHDNIVMEVKDVCKKDKIKDASFVLRKGEILGFYGLVGSGRTELARLIIGEDQAESGEVILNGKGAVIGSVSDALYKYKIGYLSENRKEEGLFLDESVKMNIGITMLPFLKGKLNLAINTKREEKLSEKYIQKLDIKTFGYEQAVGTLSGGNQQKVSISKWLATECEVFIVDEPTIGVDIGAKEQIHEIIWDLAYTYKKTIILISSDLPEILTLARRILVFRKKEIVGEIIDIYDSKGNLRDKVNHEIGGYLM